MYEEKEREKEREIEIERERERERGGKEGKEGGIGCGWREGGKD